ncbi:hypothetical protein B1R94_25935 [Mycolicibacterium litorale]|nr:hypothetical protein B1R94_25935 [Mycolicibacterium litorale]
MVLDPVLDRISDTCDHLRARNDEWNRAEPEIWMMRATPGEVGLKPIGRLPYQVATKAKLPRKDNVTATATMNWRLDHWLARELIKTPNDPDVCKNIVLIVRRGNRQWSGILHHWDVETRRGVHYFTTTWNDDMQFLQFMLGPPNPALPLPLFQGPRVLPIFFPAKYAISLLILMNLVRIEGHPWTLADDPFDLASYDDLFNWFDWQIRIKCAALPFDDSSLWTLLATRMNTIDSTIADALDDGQLSIIYRRIMTDWGDTVEGLIGGDNVANGTLVFEVVDRSGYYSDQGTLLTQNMFAGAVRSIVVYAAGTIDDTVSMFADDESITPDEYWREGFYGTLAPRPWITLRDSPWARFDGKVSWSPATAVSAVVGGDNPTADAIAKLVIETSGNLLGYFLLGGFDSLGDIAADVIMPFIVGTIAAWDEWKNLGRARELGWVHLPEIYQRGAEANSMSLLAGVVMRGAFNATKSETSHQISLRNGHWALMYADIGDRVCSTQYGITRSGIDIVFINQLKEMTDSWDHLQRQPFTTEWKIGQNKAAMSTGERSARLLKKALQTMNEIGWHLIS